MSSLNYKRVEYASKMLASRAPTPTKRPITLTIYNPELLEELKNLAFKNNTTVSAIFNNLYEYMLFQFQSPQKQIESFEFEKQIPPLYATSTTWRAYLSSLSPEEYKLFDKQLNLILELTNRRFKEI